MLYFSALVLLLGAGCSDIVKFAVDKTQPRGFSGLGIAYYIGGAGPVGNIGSFDIPRGLRDAGFLGNVEVVPWQSWNHAGDQLNLSRNREKAAELADDIRAYRRQQPDAPIHLVALSAGTGIATFALEYLPESVKVNNVVYLGCSMSAQYDMSRALRRVRGKMYVVYSSNDIILKNLVWYTGTVDRHDSRDGIAGLEGFRRPPSMYPDTAAQYDKLVNVPFRSEFRDAAYDGGHTAATNKSFVQFYIAPALMDNDRRLVGTRRSAGYRPPEIAVIDRERGDDGHLNAAVDAPAASSVTTGADPLRPRVHESQSGDTDASGSGAPADATTETVDVALPNGEENAPTADPDVTDTSEEDDPYLPAEEPEPEAR
jgi:pimeloyl-ACP methyl ester carboxylesterase